MILHNVMLIAAATLIVATMVVHSWLGERRLIGPLLANPTGVLANDLARAVLRFVWHLTSGIGLIVAVALFAAAIKPDVIIPVLILTTGIVFLAAGLIDAVTSRGRHIGWPPLTAIGVAALASWWLG